MERGVIPAETFSREINGHNYALLNMPTPDHATAVKLAIKNAIHEAFTSHYASPELVVLKLDVMASTLIIPKISDVYRLIDTTIDHPPILLDDIDISHIKDVYINLRGYNQHLYLWYMSNMFGNIYMVYPHGDANIANAIDITMSTTDHAKTKGVLDERVINVDKYLKYDISYFK